MHTWRSHAWVPAALLVVLVVNLLTVREGHDWGDDFALYVMHARNLAGEQGYGETGYVPNPRYPLLSPPAYPPGLPGVLTPVVWARGLDFAAMKAVVVLGFVAGLGAAAWAMREMLTPRQRAGLVLAVGLCPWFIAFKNSVLSDLPFLLPLMGAMAVLQGRGEGGEVSVRRGVAGGLLMAAAIATRSAGIALPAAVLLSELVRRGRVSAGAGTAVAIAAVLMIVQAMWIPGDYLMQMGVYLHDPAEVLLIPLGNARASFDMLAELWASEAAAWAALPTVLLLSGFGFVRQWRKGAGVREMFVPVYLALLLTWPMLFETRFFIPLIVLMVGYALSGWRGLWESGAGTWRAAAVLSAVLIAGPTAVDWAASYAAMERGPMGGVDGAEAQRMFAFMREQTSDGDLIVAGKPRAVALFTGRRSATYAPSPEVAESVADLEDLGATHLLVMEEFAMDQRVLEAMLQARPERFTLLRREGKLRFYAVKGR